MAKTTPAGADDPRWAKFLDRLAETSNVQGSARHAKLSKSAVYARKRSDAEFERQMLKALVHGYDALEMLLVYLLRTGQLEPVGGTTKTGRPKMARRHDIGAITRVLQLHRETRARAEAVLTRRPEAEIRAALDAKLDAIKARRKALAGTVGRKPAGERRKEQRR